MKLLMTQEWGPLKVTPRTHMWFKKLVNYVRMHPHAAAKRGWFFMGDDIRCKGLDRLDRLIRLRGTPNEQPNEAENNAGGNAG